MSTDTNRWAHAWPGSIIEGGDGLSYTVDDYGVERFDAHGDPEMLRVAMHHAERPPVTASLPADRRVSFLKRVPVPEWATWLTGEIRAAVEVIREALPGVTVDCGWCNGDDDLSPCWCESRCDAKRCVNF